MFRKMAIALVAASVFTAPVLAQNPPSGGANTTKNPQGAQAPQGPQSTPAAPSENAEKAEKPEKAEKSAATTEKSTKTVTRHHRVVSHHRRGAKTAKYVKSHAKTTIYGKHPGVKTAKYAKIETHRIGHGKTVGRGHNRTSSMHAYGRASKRMPSKSMTKPGVD